MSDLRIGQGFDIHKLVEGRKFILGGVEIAYEKGLYGHSDADALIHAIIDALFGALSLGDIGTHFPDNDDKYKDIDSIVLLKEAYNIVKSKGYIINNIDSTIMAQEISEVLEINENQISIKAKTMEEQDSVGQKKSIAAQSVVLLKRI